MLKLILLPNFLIISVLSAPIADIIRGRPDLSRSAAIIARNPAWTGAGPVTVFVATDAAIAAAANLNPDKLGSFTMNGALDFMTSQNYRIVEDVDGVNRMVYDNYAGGQPTPEIHCRFGTGEAIARAWLRADNGWVYVIDQVIVPPLSPLATMKSSWTRNSRFAALIEGSGMADAINGLTGSTILTPVDEFYTRSEAQINGYTLAQRQALIWNHVIPRVMYSTALMPGLIPTRNANEQITVALGADLVTYNGLRVFPADDMSTAGVHHRIEGVIIPANLASATSVLPSNAPTATTTAASRPTPAVQASSARASASATAKPNANSGKQNQMGPFVYFGIACMTLLAMTL